MTNLPESEGKTTIAVFVDRLTKMVHFFPCTKEITATEYAHLFVNQAFRLHGMPEVIRGVPRTGFWNGASTLKKYFVLPRNGSKYYLKYMFLAFPVLGIFRLGTPLEVIISDRDSRFVSKLWEEMFSLLGTDLWFNVDFSSADRCAIKRHHPCSGDSSAAMY